MRRGVGVILHELHSPHEGRHVKCTHHFRVLALVIKLNNVTSVDHALTMVGAFPREILVGRQEVGVEA